MGEGLYVRLTKKVYIYVGRQEVTTNHHASHNVYNGGYLFLYYFFTLYLGKQLIIIMIIL